MYNIIQKQKFADLIIFFCGFSNFYENQKVLNTNLSIHKPSMESCEVPKQTIKQSMIEETAKTKSLKLLKLIQKIKENLITEKPKVKLTMLENVASNINMVEGKKVDSIKIDYFSYKTI